MAAEEKIRAALSQLDSALKSDSLDTLSAKHFRVGRINEYKPYKRDVFKGYL